jgi:hypothetical protein
MGCSSEDGGVEGRGLGRRLYFSPVTSLSYSLFSFPLLPRENNVYNIEKGKQTFHRQRKTHNCRKEEGTVKVETVLGS